MKTPLTLIIQSIIAICLFSIAIDLDRSYDPEHKGFRLIEVITLDRKGTGKGADD